MEQGDRCELLDANNRVVASNSQQAITSGSMMRFPPQGIHHAMEWSWTSLILQQKSTEAVGSLQSSNNWGIMSRGCRNARIERPLHFAYSGRAHRKLGEAGAQMFGLALIIHHAHSYCAPHSSHTLTHCCTLHYLIHHTLTHYCRCPQSHTHLALPHHRPGTAHRLANEVSCGVGLGCQIQRGGLLSHGNTC